MKKFYLFLLALICSVTSWATEITTGKAYFIKNNASGAYISISTTVSGEVSLQSTPEKIYFQAGATTGTYYISNTADGGKYINAWYWYATPSDNATEWTINDVDGGVRLQCSYGYLAPDAASAGAALWSDKAETHSYGIYTIEEYDAKSALKAAIAAATAKAGTGVGYLDATEVKNLTDAAQAVYDNSSATDSEIESATTTLNEGVANLNYITPVSGKTYNIISALPGFETQQSVKKAMYANGTTLSWKTLNPFDLSMFWTITPEDDGYAIVNESTKTYIGIQATQSSSYPMTSDATTATLTFLGSGQVNIKTTGSGYAMHTGGHSSGAGVSGNVVAWDGSLDSGSAWYIVEAEDPTFVDVTYNYTLSGTDTQLTKTQSVAIGDVYPTPVLPSSNYTSADYYTCEIPSGTVSEATTKTIAVTQSLPFTISSSYDDATWYTMTLSASKAYLYYSEGQTQMNLDRTTTSYDDSDLFCFTGNIFDGITIYNKAAGSDKVLSAPVGASNPYDGKTGGITYVTLNDKGATSTIQAWDASKGSTFDSKTGFYLSMHGYTANIRMNSRNENSSSSNYVAFWNSGAGDGSTFLVEEVSMSAAKILLKEAIATATASVGNTLGKYPQTAIDAAQTVFDEETSTDDDYTAARTALLAAFIKPDATKYYTIKNAYANKYMSDNGSTVVSTSYTGYPEIWQFEEITEGDYAGSYYIKNYSTGQYLSTISWGGTLTTVTDATNKGAYDIFSGRNIVIDNTFSLVNWKEGTGTGDLGTINYYSDTRYNSWNANDDGMNNFYIEEIELPASVEITYTTADGKYNKTYSAAIGGAYPTPEAPNYMIILGDAPTEAVTEATTITLTYTTRYDIAATVDDIQTYYALDIHGNEAKYPLYTATDNSNVLVDYIANVDADDYTKGAVKSDNYAWAFVGDPFTGIKLYNKGSQTYATQTNDADEAITLSADGTTFMICATTSGLANSFALKADGRSYYFNHRGTQVQGWNAADGGSSLRAYEINTTDISLDQKMGAQYGTLVIPFYSAIPEGMKVYTCSVLNGNILTLTETTDIVRANTAYIVEGTSGSTYTYSNTSNGNYTDATTTGVLTGVYTATTPADGTYVMQKINGTLGFYIVNSATQAISVPANRCYMTAPSSGIKAFYFDQADAIQAVEALTSGDAKIYDLNGHQLQHLQKGINIVNGKKIMVK